jgi:membrane associated rhomboid family serine protease
MGIHDREYYRDETPAGINLGGDWSIVAKLIVINAVVFIADKFSGNHWLMESMVASPESIAKPWMSWQLISYAFAHDYNGFNHIFWNMFALWIFGKDIEGVYGKKEFLWMYLAAAGLGGLTFALRCMAVYEPADWPNHRVLGASGAVTAVTLLYCLHFPKRTILLMMILPVPAWALGLMIIVGNLAGLLNPVGYTAFDVHIAGAVFAICYYKFGWRVSSWVPGWRIPKIKRATKLKLHDPAEDYGKLDTEGDRLLQKVSRDGIDSLTKAEKRKLEAYSRRMKQKHR